MAEPIIRALSEATIHQIAAGEVIERPANAIKELVENSLDAGATRITISYEDGGKSLIRVADNGKGMVLEDLRRCWLPHTTSKIRELNDLDQVATLGFRGEALCSMAAVGRMTVETRPHDVEAGAALTIQEGAEESMQEMARSPGTTVTLRHLFLNNPVRRKFLGSPRSEGMRILNQVTRLALARPDVAFKLQEGPKEILQLREGTLKHRAGEILGFRNVDELLPVHWSDGQWRVEGLVSTAQSARQRNHHQYFYVNNRNVFSPVLQKALSGSYDVLPPGHHPVAVLFITLPPGDIDVNIHPTKREIRFLHESRVRWAIGQAVTHALRLAVGAPRLEFPPPDSIEPVQGLARGGGEERPFLYVPGEIPLATVEENPGASKRDAPRLFEFPFPSAGGDAPGRGSVGEDHGLEKPLAALAKPEEEGVGAVPYLQVHHRFILFTVSGGMMMVNQQAAHERVLYEKALEDLRRPGRFSSQQLLFPEVVELSAGEAEMAEKHAKSLQALGFELEAFGGRAFQLRGLPPEVQADKSKRVLHDLLQDLSQEEGQSPPAGEEMLQKLARAFSRVTCVRLGEPLDHQRMSALMDALFATRNPYVSPSGAPVVIRFGLTDLNRRFGLKEKGE